MIASVKPSSAARPAASAKNSALDSEKTGAASSDRYLRSSAGARPAEASVSSNWAAQSATARHQVSRSSVRVPLVTQPWPSRAAIRIDRRPFAATTNGTRGC
jgi:hypothetical protein